MYKKHGNKAGGKYTKVLSTSVFVTPTLHCNNYALGVRLSSSIFLPMPFFYTSTGSSQDSNNVKGKFFVYTARLTVTWVALGM